MDAHILAMLENTVVQMMNQHISFTSLDVANSMKTAGYQIRNREAADWLRRNVTTLSFTHGITYNATLITVQSKEVGPTSAYLYHHDSVNPDDYLDRDQNPRPVPGGIPGPVGPVSPSDPSAVSSRPIPTAAPATTVTVTVTAKSGGAGAKLGNENYKGQTRDRFGRFIPRRSSLDPTIRQGVGNFGGGSA